VRLDARDAVDPAAFADEYRALVTGIA
jgi:hypothetical protein